VPDLPDLETVLDEAVKVYLIAKKRCALMRHSNTSSFTAEDLAKEYPDYFEPFIKKSTGEHKYKVIGKTADVILEEYLAQLGYPSNSDLWYTLAHIVIERGEYESDFDRDLDRPTRRRRRHMHE
tara:strand:+ start:3950 stop:4321 length:372 start_codon:yes stop_codon:yes gene_type:complete